MGDDQTGICEGLDIQNWRIFGNLPVIMITNNSTGIIAKTDAQFQRIKAVFTKCKDGSTNNK